VLDSVLEPIIGVELPKEAFELEWPDLLMRGDKFDLN
jgi:hypothetical protein